MMIKVWVGLGERLVGLERRADGWKAESRLEGRAVACLAADPLDATRLYCGTGDAGVWRSDDGGVSWRRMDRGIASADVRAVAVSRVERAGAHGVVYAGTEPSAVFRSDDGGEYWAPCTDLQSLPSSGSWQFPPRPWTHHVRAIGLSPVQPGLLFVCIEAGALIRSRDAGRTWEDRVEGGPYDTHTLVIPETQPNHLYAAAGDGWFESPDAGETWRRPRHGMRWSYLWGLALSGDAASVIVSASPSAARAHTAELAESTVFRRAGQGEWEESPPATPRGSLGWSLAAHPSEAGTFFAANNRGLYVSDDAGRGWHHAAQAWGENSAEHVRAMLVTSGVA